MYKIVSKEYTMQNDTSVQDQEKILAEYEKQTQKITAEMVKVLMRAQRKVDNEAYRNLLDKFKDKNLHP